ncbi:hypothetical protein F4810DRAFT_705945 [Camillea tinctor]|nr:hypothetical protein F4810DRAFT_705945 [Camillea tinctor]
MSGQFGFMAKLGATPEAVAVLNDQPYVFTILVVVLVILIAQSVLLCQRPNDRRRYQSGDVRYKRETLPRPELKPSHTARALATICRPRRKYGTIYSQQGLFLDNHE